MLGNLFARSRGNTRRRAKKARNRARAKAARLARKRNR